MNIINFPAIIAKLGFLKSADVEPTEDLIIVGKRYSDLRNGTQYREMPMTIDELVSTVQNVLPAGPKVYAAVLRDNGILDPSVNFVITNDFTQPVSLKRLGPGAYSIECVGFTNQKTTAVLTLRNEAMSDSIVPYIEPMFIENTAVFFTFAGDLLDGYLNNAQIIVTTYN